MPHPLNSIRFRPQFESFEHPARTALAAALSLMVARAFRLPEPYWAPITALVVTQSTVGAAWIISRQRFIGTALGASLGALLAPFLGSNVIGFGLIVFGIGVLCAALHLDNAAYRFAGITLAIVMLIERTIPAWVIALNRFLEVSLGIAVGLAFTAVWPARKRPAL